jgi:hypothetical protein
VTPIRPAGWIAGVVTLQSRLAPALPPRCRHHETLSVDAMSRHTAHRPSGLEGPAQRRREVAARPDQAIAESSSPRCRRRAETDPLATGWD